MSDIVLTGTVQMYAYYDAWDAPDGRQGKRLSATITTADGLASLCVPVNGTETGFRLGDAVRVSLGHVREPVRVIDGSPMAHSSYLSDIAYYSSNIATVVTTGATIRGWDMSPSTTPLDGFLIPTFFIRVQT